MRAVLIVAVVLFQLQGKKPNLAGGERVLPDEFIEGGGLFGCGLRLVFEGVPVALGDAVVEIDFSRFSHAGQAVPFDDKKRNAFDDLDGDESKAFSASQDGWRAEGGGAELSIGFGGEEHPAEDDDRLVGGGVAGSQGAERFDGLLFIQGLQLDGSGNELVCLVGVVHIGKGEGGEILRGDDLRSRRGRRGAGCVRTGRTARGQSQRDERRNEQTFHRVPLGRIVKKASVRG